MVGWDGAWKRVVAGVLVVGCQRLEVVSEDGGQAEGDDDAIETSSESGDAGPGSATTATTNGSGSGSGSGGEPPEPEGTVWCAFAGVCECYGVGKQLCDVVTDKIGCGYLDACEPLVGRARESCAIEAYCDAGGTVDGTTVLCNDVPRECAGTCDLDPTACDPDGDGVMTFSCGPSHTQCGLDQFCVSTADVWHCGGGDITDGDWLCVDAPTDCEGDTLAAQRACLTEAWCVIPWADYSGRQITCEDDECHG